MKPKKIISTITEASLEFSKDTVKQLGKQVTQTLSPTALLHAAQNKPPSNDIGEYLKNLGDPSLQQPGALAAKQQNVQSEDDRKLKELQMILHKEMTKPPPKPQQPRAYEQTMKELEEKTARELEQKRQQAQAMSGSGEGKKKKGPGSPMHQKASTGMETKMNVKTG